MPLRPYQNTGVTEIRAALATHRAPLYVLPTGGGKTVIFTFIAQAVAQRKKRVWIIEHREELIEQTSKALQKFDVNHGVIMPDVRPNPLASVQVVSVQTMGRRLHNWPAQYAPDLIIIDEAHHATAGTYRTICEHYPKAKILGVTATPVRTDGQGLGVGCGGLFDKLILGPQIADLIAASYLVQPAVYAPSAALDFSGVKASELVTAGDFNKKVAAEKVDKASITGDAVEHYQRLAHGSPCAVFCVSIAHAEHVAAQFAAAGYRAYSVSGETEKSLRKRILKGLGVRDAGGRYMVEVVCSCDVISEGTDIPNLGCGIMLRPTLSLSLFLQQAGRILRPCEGKARAVLLDHVGNVARHGMPDDAREWSLEGDGEGKRNRLGAPGSGARFDTCPQCFNYQRPAPTCSGCGFVWPVAPPEKIEPIREGELIEIGQTERQKIAALRRAEIAAAESLEDLQRLARQKGWPSTWAVHTWNERQARTLQVA